MPFGWVRKEKNRPPILWPTNQKNGMKVDFLVGWWGSKYYSVLRYWCILKTCSTYFAKVFFVVTHLILFGSFSCYTLCSFTYLCTLKQWWWWDRTLKRNNIFRKKCRYREIDFWMETIWLPVGLIGEDSCYWVQIRQDRHFVMGWVQFSRIASESSSGMTNAICCESRSRKRSVPRSRCSRKI